MRDLNTLTHYPPLDELTNILMSKTQNNTPIFFRVMIAYYFTKVASTMRVNIKTHDRGTIPVNMYAINLAISGSGKGYSTNIVEEQIIHNFKRLFLEHTFPAVADKNIAKISINRATRDNTDPDETLTKVQLEFNGLGPFVFSFDSGTSPAVKQMRQKLLMANCGSINLEIDEIGSNLLSNMDVLNVFLELFDIGKVKQKLTKNTSDNRRSEDLDGRTPTNMMLFGTPSKLLFPGSKTEEEFYAFLNAGYARRCFFGISRSINDFSTMTAQQLYDLSTDIKTDSFIEQLSNNIARKADEIYYGTTLEMDKPVALLFTEYQILCRQQAMNVPEYEEARKAELQHRFYKTMKLAGVYAFLDGSPVITEDHAYYAIKLAEDSGLAFQDVLRREKPHQILANYIAKSDDDLTIVDLMDNLPFFKGSESARKDLLTRATIYGYKHNIVIKQTAIDGIEFISGETLKETNLDELIVSYSKDLAQKYKPEKAPFDKMNRLVQAADFHYTAHHFKDGHRSQDKLIKGFNLVILDVDDGTQVKMAKMLLEEYQYIIATTKRHTPEKNRFRVILPMAYILELDSELYSKFMQNLFNWLPFPVDEATKDCARKWESFKGDYHVNQGKLLNPIPFIPNTSEQEKQAKRIQSSTGLDSLERWFMLHADIGNRNNLVLRYALSLIDRGYDETTVKLKTSQLNSKLEVPLSNNELAATVMKTITRKFEKI